MDLRNYLIFHLLTETLERIESEEDPWLAIRYYEMHLLDLLGYRPHLFECANCGRKSRPWTSSFSPAAGGVLCPRLRSGSARCLACAGGKHLSTWRHFQRRRLRQCSKGPPRASGPKRGRGLLQGYVTYLLERSLKFPRIYQANKKIGAIRHIAWFYAVLFSCRRARPIRLISMIHSMTGPSGCQTRFWISSPAQVVEKILPTRSPSQKLAHFRPQDGSLVSPEGKSRFWQRLPWMEFAAMFP